MLKHDRTEWTWTIKYEKNGQMEWMTSVKPVTESGDTTYTDIVTKPLVLHNVTSWEVRIPPEFSHSLSWGPKLASRNM